MIEWFSVAPYLVSVLVKVIGMAVVAGLLRRWRPVALWSLAGLAILAACDVWAGLSPSLTMWLHSATPMTTRDAAFTLSLTRLARSLIVSVGVGCLVVALVWKRRASEAL
jgi:hypothetical protein